MSRCRSRSAGPRSHAGFLPPAPLGLKVGRQRLGLAARAVKRAQVQFEQDLVGRVLVGEVRDLAHQIGVAPEPQAGLDAMDRGTRRSSFSRDPDPFHPVAVEPVQWDAAPERIRLVVEGDREFVVAVGSGGPRLDPSVRGTARHRHPDGSRSARRSPTVRQFPAASRCVAQALPQSGHVLVERLERAV